MNKTVNDGAKPNNSMKDCNYIMTTKEQLQRDIDAWCKLVQSAYGLGHTMGQCVVLRWYGLLYLTFISLISVSCIFQALEIKIPFLGLINFLIMIAVGFFAARMVKVEKRKDESWEAERMEELKKDCFKVMNLEETEVKEEDAIHNY